MKICSLTDKFRLKAFLNTDRAYHAYALADLSDPFFGQCRWLAAEEGDEIATMVLIYEGLDPPVLLAMGQAGHLPDIFEQVEMPATAMFLGREEHASFLLKRYKTQRLDKMWRMTLPPNTFQPVPSGDAVRLDERHLDALETIFRDEHSNAFAPYQLRQGVFYGLFLKGELASVAGTHIVAPEYGVGAVGNIYTRPQHRGKGFAQQVTSAVCADLLAQNLDTIILNVEQRNVPAVQLYQKLGFVAHCSFLEGIGEIRD